MHKAFALLDAMLRMLVANDSEERATESARNMRNGTFGISSDALVQSATVFTAITSRR